ncbi:cytochrome P450 71D95-like [Andrographis paniculata]|uniref:cytochrome P450 71D95-like n=1 Tax=Andrographis paniculata TaxID=175694 RepID=UPI0021E96915|nr:cytochrome P450 71D95-like [Andrographis paniculata]
MAVTHNLLPVIINQFTALLLLGSFIFLLLKIRRGSGSGSAKPSDKNVKLPPCPPRLPVIGHLHHLSGGLAHQMMAKMAKKYGPVMRLQLGQVSAVVISSREAAKEVLKVQDPACADRPESIGTNIVWKADMVFSPYNDFWRQMRKICIMELLSAKNVKSFESVRRDEVSRLLQSIRAAALAGEAVNVTEKAVGYASSMTCRAAFGTVGADKRDVLIDMMKRASTMAGGFELADLFPSSKLLNILCWNKYRLNGMRRKVDAILDVIVDEHRLKRKGEFGGEDTVDVLLRVQSSGEFEFPISNDNIKGVIYDLFSAGTETSSTAMDWAMVELMRCPRAMARLQAEVREALKGKETVEEGDLQKLTYLKWVIKETLRMHPPVSLIPRACRSDNCTVDGYTIPKNSKVIINAWSLGRDPKYWDQPDTFMPERFENSTVDFLGNSLEFIPFGAGRRICPGLNFGLANLVVPLSQLMYHFDWHMPEGVSADDIDLTEEDGLSISRKNPLFLVPTLYNDGV